MIEGFQKTDYPVNFLHHLKSDKNGLGKLHGRWSYNFVPIIYTPAFLQECHFVAPQSYKGQDLLCCQVCQNTEAPIIQLVQKLKVVSLTISQL